MAVTKKKSISQFCTKLCGDFFFCKEKGEGSNAGRFFKIILQRYFQFKGEFLRSAGENNAHCNFNCTLKIILQLF